MTGEGIAFLEKSLEDIISRSPRQSLRERGLHIKGRLLRQLNVGRYGIADIVTFERDTFIEGPGFCHQGLHITVYELKKDKVDFTALGQAMRYGTGIISYLSKRKCFEDARITISFVVIGGSICLGDFCYLPTHIENVQVYTYKYDFDGIQFHQESEYVLTNPGF